MVVLGVLTAGSVGGAAGAAGAATAGAQPPVAAATAPMAGAVATTQTCTTLTLNGSVTTELTTSGCYVIENDVTNATADPLIRIAATGVTIDGRGNVLDGAGNGTAIRTDPTLSVGDPIVENLTATDWREAVVLNDTSQGTVRDLAARNVSVGVVFAGGTTNSVVRNVTVDGADFVGIAFISSTVGNTVRDVRIRNVSNGPGVEIDGDDTRVSNVTVRESALGLAVVGATGTYGGGVRVGTTETGVLVDGTQNAATTDTAIDDIDARNTETAFVTEIGPSGVRNTNNTFRAFRTGDATLFDIEDAQNVAVIGRGSSPALPRGLSALGPSFDAAATGERAYLDVNVSYDEAAVDGFKEQSIRLWRANGTLERFVRGENAVFKAENTVAANATAFGVFAAVGISDQTVIEPLTADSGATVTHRLTTAYLNMSGNGQTNTVQAVFNDTVAGNLTLESATATDLDGSEVYSVSNAAVVDGPDQDGLLDTVSADVSTTRAEPVDAKVNFSVTVAYPSVASDTTVPIDRRIVDANGTTDRHPWANVSLQSPDTTTQPQSEPDIAVSTTSLGFGSVPVNDSATATLTVTNEGQAGLSVSELDLDGTDADLFSVDAGAFRLAPNESRTLTVTFEPVATGAADASLSIRSDDPSRPVIDVNLDGIGISSDMTVNASRLDFGTVPAGEAATRTLTVRNDGSANLTVENVTVAGANASAFASERSTLRVPGGTERSLNVTFAPASPGTKDARLALSSEASGTVDVGLAGNATASALSAPASLDFAETPVEARRTQGVRVSNAGSSPVELSVATAGSTAFTATTDTVTVPAGGSERVVVAFAPRTEGPANGTLVLRGGGAPTNVSLRGEGVGPRLAVTPPALAFGNVSAGSTVDAQLAVENAGGGTLNVTGLFFSGPDASVFVVESTTPSLGPGESAAVNVTFAPSEPGPRTATLTVVSTAGREAVGLNGTGAPVSLSVSPRSLAFGSTTPAAPVTRTVTVTNSGDRPVPLSRLAVRGADASSFVVADDAPASVPAGGARDVRVRFRPRSSGQATARLVLASNDSAVPTRSVALRGSGAVPDVRVRPTSLSFGSVAVNESVTRNLTVVNEGTAALTVEDVALTSGLDPVTDVGAPTTAVEPGTSATIPVTFTPAEQRTYAGTLQVVTDDPDEPVVPVWVANSNTTANLSLEAGRDRTNFSATVTDAEPGSEVGFEFGGTRNGTDGAELTGVAVQFSENGSAPAAGAALATAGRLGRSLAGSAVAQDDGIDFTLNATSSATPLSATPEFRTPANGTIGLRYVDVTHSFPNSAVENASLTFRVDRERLDSLRGTDPEDVVVYRYADGQWVERPTEIVAERNGTLVLQATASGFSDWTVGAKQASFDVVRADVSVTSVTTGDSVNVNVRIENTGGADGEFLTELLLNQAVVDSREVEIAAGGTAQVTFDRSFDQPGTYSVRVNDVPAGQVDVTTENVSGTTTAAGTETSSGSGDALGVALVALVVTAAAAAAGRRRDPS